MPLVARLLRAVRSIARLPKKRGLGYTNFGRHVPKEHRGKWIDWRNNHRNPSERFIPLTQPPLIPAAEATYLQADENIVGIVLNDDARAYPTQILGFRHLVQDRVGGEPVLLSYCMRCSSSIGFRPLVDGEERHFLVHGGRDGTFTIIDQESRTVWSQLTGKASEGPDAGRQLEQLQVFQMAWQHWREMHPTTLVLDPADDFSWTHIPHAMGVEGRRARRSASGADGQTPGRHSMGLGVRLDGAALLFLFEKMASSGIAQATMGRETPVTIFYDPASRGCGAYRTADEMTPGAPGQWHDLRTRSTWNLRGVCTAGARAGERLVFVPSHSVQWHAWARHHPQTAVWNHSTTSPALS